MSEGSDKEPNPYDNSPDLGDYFNKVNKGSDNEPNPYDNSPDLADLKKPGESGSVFNKSEFFRQTMIIQACGK